ncbi:MAG: acyl-protein synthetase [Alphaproteobacteria bacterium]
MLDDLLTKPPFSLRQAEKERLLLPILKDLTRHHRQQCKPYNQIVSLTSPQAEAATSLSQLPYLPVSLFKFRDLRSVPQKDIRTTVTSSGTTGSLKSRIDLDAITSKLSSKALALIMGDVLGQQRLPMLIIDCQTSLQKKEGMGARAAAILGLMPFGRDHCFALRDDLSLDEEKITAFLKTHAEQDILIFGFTFLIWQSFGEMGQKDKFDFSRATLLHSGGWKKLADVAIDNDRFKSQLFDKTGITKVINFYGMAELPGTVFIENENGLLVPPHFADVIIRDPLTFEPLPPGEKGLVQIVSALPHSYPGHSLLTEDMGVIKATDKGRYGGHGLRILGRAPRAELRGCSDVIAEGKAA